MSARRKSKRNLKRKQPDTIDKHPSQPHRKKRKLSRPHNTHKPKSITDDKSKSTSPKKKSKKHTSKSNPFSNVTIPSIKPKPKTKPKLTQRVTEYKYKYQKQTKHNRNSHSSDSDTESDSNSDSDQTDSSPETSVDPTLPNHTNIRSQPATPIRNQNLKKSAPHSQSAKRHKIRSYKHGTNVLKHRRTPLPISPLRRNMPRLNTSQDSIGFSDCSPEKTVENIQNINERFYANVTRTPQRNTKQIPNSVSHIIPVNATPIRPNNGNTYERLMGNESVNNIGESSANDEKQPSKPTIPSAKMFEGLFERDSWVLLALFLLVGFVSGVIVTVAVYKEQQIKARKHRILDTHPKYNIINDQCTCDIRTNRTNILCSPCMDQYWALKSKCDNVNGIQILRERDGLRNEKERLENELRKQQMCEQRLDRLGIESAQCKSDRVRLNREIERLKGLIGGRDGNKGCDGYKEKMGELEHELGECNVEWGSCEQLGRQKDKLDEKRVEEIGKQKRKFSLCNEQLKRYKDEAKRNKREQ